MDSDDLKPESRDLSNVIDEATEETDNSKDQSSSV